MAVVTATQVTVLSNINASAVTVLNSGLIEIVQDRLCIMTNNYFTSEELMVQSTAVFNATARSIVIDQTSWEEFGFQAGDDFLIYRSYRNDGVYTFLSLSGNTGIVVTAQSVVNEAFNNNLGKVICFAQIRWPKAIQYIAAQMVAYDHDVRPSVAQNITSRSLGPLSETYTNSSDEWGYPKSITEALVPYRIARLM